MNKKEFEAADGGIGKGDLILVVTRDSFLGEQRLISSTGRYDPIEDLNHPYLKDLERSCDSDFSRRIGKGLVDQGYLVLKDHRFLPDRPEHGVLSGNSHGQTQRSYDITLRVKRLLRSEEFEEFVGKP